VWVTSRLGSSVPASSIDSTRSTWPITFAGPALSVRPLIQTRPCDLVFSGTRRSRPPSPRASETDREIERAGVADGVDRDRDAATAGERLRHVAGLCSVRWTGTARTARPSAAVLDGVDRQHRSRPRRRRPAPHTARRVRARAPRRCRLARRRRRKSSGSRFHDIACEQRDVVGDAVGTLRSVMSAGARAPARPGCPGALRASPRGQTSA